MAETREAEGLKKDGGDGDLNIWANVCSDEDSYYRLESWYPDIKEFTFDTKVIPLSMDEAMSIKKYKEMSKLVLGTRDIERHGRVLGDWADSDFLELDGRIKELMDHAQVNMLTDLQSRIDEAIRPYVEKGNSAFVKLSTRSPKDSAFFSSKMKDMLKRDIEASPFKGGTEEADVEDMIIYVRASVQCLAIQSGAEAMQLLIRSNCSKRVHDDISLGELMKNETKEFYLALVVREWSSAVLPEWEYRVFVINGKLTAATQYTSLIFVPGMAEKREGIKALIQEYYEKVRHNIKCPSYTLDLALNPDLDISRVQIVELNGPPPSAGTSLYNWDDPNDKQQIMEGTNGFTVRISEKPTPDVKKEIHPPLRRYMAQLRGVPVSDEDELDFQRISCDQCRRSPIGKTFYHCITCNKYDECEECYVVGVKHEHEPGHIMKQMGEKKDIPRPSRSRSSTSTKGCTIA